MPDLDLRAIILLQLAPLIHAAESYDFRIQEDLKWRVSLSA